MDLFDETAALVRQLRESGVDYGVVGAIALAVHGAPRATTDIDPLVRAADVDAALGGARACGFTLEALPMSFADGLRIRRVSKVAGPETLTLDLLLVDANLEPVWASRRPFATPFGDIVVVSRDALIQMKAWAGRQQDLADIERLREIDR